MEGKAGTVPLDPRRVSPITPIHILHPQHTQALGALGQDRLGEIDGGKLRVDLLYHLGLTWRSQRLLDALEGTHQLRRKRLKES